MDDRLKIVFGCSKSNNDAKEDIFVTRSNESVGVVLVSVEMTNSFFNCTYWIDKERSFLKKGM